jgi:von Willebrand factor type A domain
MRVSFVTPLAGVLALAALVPLGVFLARRRRLAAIRESLGLAAQTVRDEAGLLVALAAIPVLLGAAAMQPVVETTRTAGERTDAQVFVVLDVSRSMLASARPGAATRFERAREIALSVQRQFPGVPFGIASLTDRVLPHLFPTTDARVYATTLERAVGVDRPPPGAFYLTRATKLAALASLPEAEYFLPNAKKRALVVLTDGETESPGTALARAFEREPRIETVLVHVWGLDERIYETGVAEGGYEPDPRSADALAEVASQVGGRVLGEDDADAAGEAVREAIGEGATAAVRHETGRFALMPWLTFASAFPLGLVVVRRNVWWGGGRRHRLAVPRRAEHAAEGAKVSEPRGVAQPG